MNTLRIKKMTLGGRPIMTASRTDDLLTRRQIEGMVADGRTVFIVDGYVLKLDAWLEYHPGGDKAIMHMVGRDATDEVNALHSIDARNRMAKFRIGRVDGRWDNFLPPIQGGSFRPHTDQEDLPTDVSDSNDSECSSQDDSPPRSPLFDPIDQPIDILPRSHNVIPFDLETSSISSVSSASSEQAHNNPKLALKDALTQKEIDLDLDRYPPVDAVIQEAIVGRYRMLYARLIAEGLFECNYKAYLTELGRYGALFGTCLLCLHCGWYGASGLFLGFFWHQLVFTAHDAGHMGITHDFTTDTIIGIIIADFLGGLSLGWWKRSHNVHHIVTNSPEHDPDIEHMPFFAISHRFFDSLRSTYYNRIMSYDAFAKFTIRYQNYLYYPILTLGRFNLYRLSWEYLFLGLGPRKGPAWWHRWFEIAGQVFFWTWFGYGVLYKSIPTAGDRFLFLMVSHMFTGVLHLQITLSHFAMSTADLGIQESFPQRMLRTTMDVDCPEWLDFFHGGLQFQAIHHLFPRIPRHNLRQTQKLVQEFCLEVGIPYALYGFVDGNKEVVGRLRDVGRQAAILAECQRHVAATGL